MKGRERAIKEQIQRHAVALISLVVAVTSLAYNTYRNEKTEFQRNLRHAAFELISELGQLQASTNAIAYGSPENRAAERLEGFGHLLTIRALAPLLPHPVLDAVADLDATWATHVDRLGDPAYRDISDRQLYQRIETVLTATRTVMQSLD